MFDSDAVQDTIELAERWSVEAQNGAEAEPVSALALEDWKKAVQVAESNSALGEQVTFTP